MGKFICILNYLQFLKSNHVLKLIKSLVSKMDFCLTFFLINPWLILNINIPLFETFISISSKS